MKIKNNLIALIYTIISIISIIICLICNIIISHTISWYLIVLFSIVFSWLIIMPLLIFTKKKKISISLISLTIFIIPYLLTLSLILHNFTILKIGSISSIISLIYLWATYFVYLKVPNQGLKGAAIELLLTAVFSLSINIAISLLLSTNTLNISNIICIIILFIFSIICFIYDHKFKE